MGHQAGKIKNYTERDNFLDWLEKLEFKKFRLPRPDLTFLLLMPVELGQLLVDKKGKRSYTDNRRDIHEADIQHLKDAEKSFRYCAKKYGWKVIECTRGNKIENIRTPASIHEEIYKITKSSIDEVIKPC
jgi:dTMP kinase